MRKHGKIDDNQPVIIDALRQLGAFVQVLSSVGKGCPDIAVGFRGMWFFIEIKDGAKSRSAATLTPSQIDWIVNLRNRAPVHVVSNVYEAMAVVTKQHEASNCPI